MKKITKKERKKIIEKALSRAGIKEWIWIFGKQIQMMIDSVRMKQINGQNSWRTRL
jgi:hypothetical protein